MNLLLSILVIGISVAYGSVLNQNSNVLDNHHNNQQVLEIIDQVNKKCPDITFVYDMGLKSVNGHGFLFLNLTALALFRGKDGCLPN